MRWGLAGILGAAVEFFPPNPSIVGQPLTKLDIYFVLLSSQLLYLSGTGISEA